MFGLYLKETPDSGSREAYLLLGSILKRDHGVAEPEICRGEHGKPFCKNGPFFNLSHTSGAILIGVSDSPVGVDVERLRPVAEKLPQRVLSAPELQWYRKRGSRREDFLTLWTLKESYYKLRGTGLPGFPNKTTLCCRDGVWSMTDTKYSFWAGREKDLFLALCSEKQTQINFHRM